VKSPTSRAPKGLYAEGLSYHSHNLGGEKSIYCSILEARGTIHVQFSGLPVASCLAVSKRDGKQLCSTLDESPKWGASPPILMRSPRMESLKQLERFLPSFSMYVRVRKMYVAMYFIVKHIIHKNISLLSRTGLARHSCLLGQPVRAFDSERYRDPMAIPRDQ
jgi:hypothetical protein